MKGRHAITNCHRFYEGDALWPERQGEMGKPYHLEGRQWKYL